MAVSTSITDDAFFENPDEFFNLQLAFVSGPAAGLSAPTSHQVTIVDNDQPTVTVTATGNGNENGPVNGQFTFTITPQSASSTTVNFTVGGSATSGTDYTGLTTPVVIPANTSSVVVQVLVVDDQRVEGTETVSVTIQSVTAGVLFNATPAQINILDNDSATVRFATANSANIEDPVTVNIGVTLTLNTIGTGTADIQNAVSVDVLDQLTGTAIGGGVDYTYSPNPKTVTFAAGSGAGTQNVQLTVIEDGFVESNETVNLGLQNVVGVATIVAPTSHVFTIINDDLPAFQGMKFHDVNGDANKAGDPGLGGWTIELYRDDGDGVFEPTVPAVLNGDGTPVDTAITDINGNYNIGSAGSLPNGTYFLREVNQTGWRQTTTPIFYTVAFTGTTINNLDFGNDDCDDLRTVTSAGTVITSVRPGILTIELQNSTPFTVSSASAFRVYDSTTKLLTAPSTTQNSRASEFATEPGYRRIDIFIPTPASPNPFVPQTFSVNLSGLVGTAKLRWNNTVNVSPTTSALQLTGEGCGDLLVVRDDPAAGDASDAKRVFVGTFTGTLNGGTDLVADGVRYNTDIINGVFNNPTISRVEINGQGGDDYVRIGSEITVQQSTINGGDGNDVIRAGNQKSTISGGNGYDFVWGGIADDVINGDNDGDWLFGAAGFDRLNGLDGNDIVHGGTDGDPLLRGGNGDDAISGGAGSDRTFGDAHNTGPGDIGYRDAADSFFSTIETCRSLTPIAGCTVVGQDEVDVFLNGRFANIWDDLSGDADDTLDELINNVMF